MTYGKAASVVVCACLTMPALAQEQSVTPNEIQETWAGKTLVGTTAGGAPASIKLLSDGSASVSAGSTGDTGTWRLSDQGYCTTWRIIRAGQKTLLHSEALGNQDDRA